MEKPSVNLNVLSGLSDLKKRILFTLIALIVYRIGSYIPLPGVNASAVLHLFQGEGGVLGMFDLFTGGSLSRMSVLALNIFPYISASIVMQLLVSTSKSLSELRKEGESGRIKINQYTRYLAIVLCAVQAYAVAKGLEAMAPSNGISAVMNPGRFFEFSTIICLVGGTAFIMWLAEQITSRGVGQGASLLIFAGIIAELPSGISNLIQLGSVGQISIMAALGVVVFVVGIIALIAFMEQAQRRIAIQYPRQANPNGGMSNNASYLPLKVNMSGVMGPVFASSIMMIPAFIMRFTHSDAWWFQKLMGFFTYGTYSYMAMFALLIVFFAYFQTAIVFNPEETAENLKNHGAYIPGIRPGAQTSSYLDFVITRISAVGVAYLIFVCVLPILLHSHFGLPVLIGGTSILIVAGVVLDTVTQIQSHLIARHYANLMKKAGKQGRFRI